MDEPSDEFDDELFFDDLLLLLLSVGKCAWDRAATADSSANTDSANNVLWSAVTTGGNWIPVAAAAAAKSVPIATNALPTKWARTARAWAAANWSIWIDPVEFDFEWWWWWLLDPLVEWPDESDLDPGDVITDVPLVELETICLLLDPFEPDNDNEDNKLFVEVVVVWWDDEMAFECVFSCLTWRCS